MSGGSPPLRDRLRRIAEATHAAQAVRRARTRTVKLLAPDLTPESQRSHLEDQVLACLAAFLLHPDSNCIDVGAHGGLFLADFVRLAPEGRHIAYEPVPQMHRDLVERFPDVDVRCAALSNVDGETEFVHVVDDPAYSGMREREYPHAVQTEKIAVRTERLDDHLPDGYAPAMMKIDVEGAECLVLEGALDTLKTHRPVVAVEHGRGGADRYGHGPDDLYHLLVEEAGLRLFDMEGTGPYSKAQLRESFAEARRWNYLAHA